MGRGRTTAPIDVSSRVVPLDPRKVISIRVHPDRYVTPTPEDPLFKSVVNVGQLIPIVVFDEGVGDLYRLIDGQRRIDIAVAMGNKVLAIVCRSFPDIVMTMEALYRTAIDLGVYVEPSSMRIYQFYRDALRISRKEENRRGGKRVMIDADLRKQLVTRGNGALFRNGLFVALGSWYGLMSRIQDVVTLYNAYSDPDHRDHDVAKGLIARHEAGQLTTSQAINMMTAQRDRSDFFHGDVVAIEEQENVLRIVKRSMSGMIKALLRLGPISALGEKEINEFLTEVKADRVLLSRFLRLLSEELSKRS